MPWYDYLRVALFIAWGVILLLTVKLLLTRRRWRHPLRGNGPMLYALFLILLGVEWARARNIEESPPPYTPSLLLTSAATLLILWWLWRQMELIPRWIRAHVPWRRTSADYSMKEHEHHAADGR